MLGASLSDPSSISLFFILHIIVYDNNINC